MSSVQVESDRYYPIDLDRLPTSWTVSYIGDVVNDIRPGFASGTHNQTGQGIPHLRPMNISRDGQFDLSEIKYVAAEKDDRRLVRGDVLFNNTNSPELVGKTAAVPVSGEFAFSNHMTRLRIAHGELSPAFVANQLHYLWMSGYFRHRCRNHVNQASIASKALANSVPIVIPPLPEQRRIVEEIEKQFTRLDAAVESLERARANLKRYRASVLAAACEGRLIPTEAELARQEGRDYEPATALLDRILAERRARWEADELAKLHAKGKPPKNDTWKSRYKPPTPPDTTDLPELPEGWEWTLTGQLTDIQGGIQKQPKRAPKNNSYPMLRVANVLRGQLDLDEIHEIELFGDEIERLRLRSGDLLIVEGNGSPAQIGRMAIWQGEIEDCVHQNHIIRARPVLGIIPKYLETYWNSSRGSQSVLAVASSTSGLYTLSVAKVSQIPIPLPPLAEQQRIVEEVERRLSVVEEMERTVEADLQRAGRLRQAILKRAFEGRLVPQDPADEPASALLERIRAEREQANPPSRSRRSSKARKPQPAMQPLFKTDGGNEHK